MPDRKALLREIAEAKDILAMNLATDLLFIDCVPAEGEISGSDLIEKVVDYCKTLSDQVLSFQFSAWRGSTMLECLDFLICCGALEGPEVQDLEEDGHLILDGKIKRSASTDAYVQEVERELFEYVELAELNG
jgi:hypothetical protein